MRLGIELNQLDNWESEYRGPDCANNCWNRVMNYLLKNASQTDYPATWKGVIELLEDVELSEVAESLKKVLSYSHT